MNVFFRTSHQSKGCGKTLDMIIHWEEELLEAASNQEEDFLEEVGLIQVMDPSSLKLRSG